MRIQVDRYNRKYYDIEDSSGYKEQRINIEDLLNFIKSKGISPSDYANVLLDISEENRDYPTLYITHTVAKSQKEIQDETEKLQKQAEEKAKSKKEKSALREKKKLEKQKVLNNLKSKLSDEEKEALGI